jgi:hypothetical protein
MLVVQLEWRVLVVGSTMLRQQQQKPSSVVPGSVLRSDSKVEAWGRLVQPLMKGLTDVGVGTANRGPTLPGRLLMNAKAPGVKLAW